MTTHYTSDTHLGHRLLAGLRGFTLPDGEPDVAAHDEYVITTWNQRVRPGDTVIHAGDVFLGGQQNLELLARLNGTKILVPGNHDRVHPMMRSIHKHLPRWLEYFASIGTQLSMSVGGIPVMINHFPRPGTHEAYGQDRFMQWRLDPPQMLLHGHTHQDTVASVDTHGVPMRNQACIGWEAWGGPVPEEELAQVLTALMEGE